MKETIFNLIQNGYTVKFGVDFIQFYIEIGDQKTGKKLAAQYMPISDHFREEKICRCIDFMIDHIKKDKDQVQKKLEENI